MSNLLQKASIITTPTAYNDGKLLSVKPVEYYGPELVTNGDFATDSDWTKGTGWTISGGKANSDGVSGASPIYQNIGAATVGTNYKIQLVVSNYTSGTLVAAYGGASATSITSNGSYTFYIQATSTDANTSYLSYNFIGSIDNVSVKEVLNADFDFTRGSSATRVGSNGLIQTVASGLPRIDYSGGVGHILTEPERTNLVTYSEDFSNSYWAKTRASITSNSIISPDGTLNASKLIEDTANGSHFLLVNPVYTTSSVNNVVSLSLFGKKSERHLQIQSFASGGGENPKVNFDLTNGTANSVGNITPTFSIQSFGNDWYRCNLTYTVSQSNSGVRFYISLFNGTSTSYQGDGSSGVYIYGAQLEVSSYPTSYIVSNSGNATTRLAETLDNSGSADNFNDSEGVLMVEASALADGGTTRAISINDGSTDNFIQFSFRPTSNTIRYRLESENVLQFSNEELVTDVTIFNKFALVYNSNNFSFWVNGVKKFLVTNASNPINLSNLDFHNGINASPFYGKTKCVAVFKEALSDLELECLSSWMSFADMGIALGYTIE